jgi:hypothetical protein
MELFLFLFGLLFGYIIWSDDRPIETNDTVIAKPKACHKSCDKYGYCDRDYLKV